jgi:hypothetical protein
MGNKKIEELFIQEYFSNNCFYWCDSVEKTNMVFEAANFLNIPMHTGDECKIADKEYGCLTVFEKENGDRYIQKVPFWHPNYGLKVRDEFCMYREFEENIK